MRPPLFHLAIVAVLTIGPMLAHPAAAQVAIGAPVISPRAMTPSAPPAATPPAAQIGTLMTLAQAQPRQTATAETAAPPAEPISTTAPATHDHVLAGRRGG